MIIVCFVSFCNYLHGTLAKNKSDSLKTHGHSRLWVQTLRIPLRFSILRIRFCERPCIFQCSESDFARAPCNLFKQTGTPWQCFESTLRTCVPHPFFCNFWEHPQDMRPPPFLCILPDLLAGYSCVIYQICLLVTCASFSRFVFAYFSWYIYVY
jgi:hypothetical protein